MNTRPPFRISFCILHSAFCIALAAASAFAQGAADNPKVFDDGLWRRTPWEGSFVPDDFIWVKPHAAYVGSNKLEIVWLTKELKVPPAAAGGGRGL